MNYENPWLEDKCRIVHIGLGAFHRAHQALYTSELLDKYDPKWTICSVNLFGSPELITQLKQQNYCYTVIERGAEQENVKLSRAITESLHPQIDGQMAVIEKMAEPQVEIISLTITEKGYCIEPSTGRLDKQHPLIKHDSENSTQPQSAIGYIVEALRMRKERRLNPLTILSCDNIQNNGDVIKTAILEYAQLIDNELYQWIKKNIQFPNTMVDRIVPAMTDETLAYITQKLNHADPCAIVCEPFRQWVIEDKFALGRPDWNKVGAEFVEDVRPYEEMKLRMLNGSHSFLAYLGYLSGYKSIDETMADNVFKQVILDFMLNEQAPTLSVPEHVDLSGYAQSLVERFSNPNLKHQTAQIAMDGSQKLPPRFCESIKHNKKHNGQRKWLELGVAGWMSYVTGCDDAGHSISVNDPFATVFEQITQQSSTYDDTVMKLLQIESIFDAELLQDKEFVENVIRHYSNIQQDGAKHTLYQLWNNKKV